MKPLPALYEETVASKLLVSGVIVSVTITELPIIYARLGWTVVAILPPVTGFVDNPVMLMVLYLSPAKPVAPCEPVAPWGPVDPVAPVAPLPPVEPWVPWVPLPLPPQHIVIGGHTGAQGWGRHENPCFEFAKL